jgi:hypothetical protein
VYGILMIAIVYFLPEGIVPAVRRVLVSRRGKQYAAGFKEPQAENK